jgi:hypothetical protein
MLKDQEQSVQGCNIVTETVIELPKDDERYDLADLFTLRKVPISEHEYQVTLQVVAIPAFTIAQSAVAWDIAEYLREVNWYLFNQLQQREAWCLGEEEHQFQTVVPTSHLDEYVEKLKTILAEVPKVCPYVFDLVEDPKACWKEKRDLGLASTKSWVEELGKNPDFPPCPTVLKELEQKT